MPGVRHRPAGLRRALRGMQPAAQRLDAADRAVVELVDLAGLRPKEAASVLGVAPGTAQMRLMRARARLPGATGRTMTAEHRR